MLLVRNAHFKPTELADAAEAVVGSGALVLQSLVLRIFPMTAATHTGTKSVATRSDTAPSQSGTEPTTRPNSASNTEHVTGQQVAPPLQPDNMPRPTGSDVASGAKKKDGVSKIIKPWKRHE